MRRAERVDKVRKAMSKRGDKRGDKVREVTR